MFKFRPYGFAISIILLCIGTTVSTVGGNVMAQNGKGRDTLRLYFPLTERRLNSSDSANSLDTFMNVWYSRILSAMKEPILTNYEGDVEIYRFTWLRSFHQPVSVRIEKQGNTVTLIGKVLSEREGSRPRKLTTKSLKLNQSDWNRARSMLSNSDFWKLRIDPEARGFDGSEWILEGSTPDRYHFTSVWSAGKKSDYGLVCLFLLKLSRIRVPAQEVY